MDQTTVPGWELHGIVLSGIVATIGAGKMCVRRLLLPEKPPV